MADVIVIGAGMAGVAAGREIARLGLSVSVVEGSDRIGGRVHTIHDFCDGPGEAGAEFVHGVGAETWPDVRGANLTTRVCPQTRNTMFDVGYGGRWLPRILLDPAVWPAFTILGAIRKVKPPDMSAREFVERRGYRGRARVMAAMVLTAHLPGNLDDIGMLGLLEDNVLKLETGVNHRVVEGYDNVPQYIGRDLDVQLGFAVEAVQWSASGVTVRTKGGREMSARAAVSTLPVGVLKSGKVRFVPELPESKRSALEALGMGPVVKILLRFEECFWPKRLAMLACATGPITLYWPVFYGAADAPPVLIAYCTGPRAAALGRLSEAEAADIARKDLHRHFPKADPKIVDQRRIDWAADPMACGGYTFVRPGGTGARARLAAADTGALFWAGSSTATRTIAATVEGAFVSGLRAAEEVRSYLGAGE